MLLASADESVKECDESLEGQRASFPQVYGETGVSHVFDEDRVSSCSCLQMVPLFFVMVLEVPRRIVSLLCPLRGMR